MKAKVRKSSGGNGFDGPRKEETRAVSLPEGYYKHGDKKLKKLTPYIVGDKVREGFAKGWWIASIG